MEFLLITAVLFVFTSFVALFSGVGRRMDDKDRRLREVSGRVHHEVDEDLEAPFLQRFLMPVFFGILKFFSRLFPKNKKNEPNKLEKYLKLAGIAMSPNEYNAARLVVTLAILGCTFISIYLLKINEVIKVLIFLFGFIIAVAGPTFYLSSRIKKRQGSIRNQLPDVMDLLTVGVEAGLGFDASLLNVQERSKGPLVDELIVVQREIQMGVTRREALKKFAERNSVPELKTFVGALIQADQLGLPIKNVLRTQSAQLRLTRKQTAEEKAMKAPVKMILPLVVFVFPVIFIVLLGPTVMQIIKTFG